MQGNKKEWYSDWFDSPYYHILYKHRDFEEAKAFIDRLGTHLQFQRGQTALDAACGRGRHAVYFHEKRLNVLGTDLSPQSIAFAKQFEKKGLEFQVRDIREVVKGNYFDFIFNLFTSFGYFENDQDNYNAIKALADQLKEKGCLVIDFMNTWRIVNELVSEEIKIEEGIEFRITRKVVNDFIVKNIAFSDKGKDYSYYEKVKIIKKEDFLNYFNFAGLSVIGMFGGYHLEPFDEHTSERMIFITGKK